MVRCFVAVFLSPTLRPQVVALQRYLAQSGADVKWVEAENLHFTVKFLGDVEESRLAALTTVLEACAGGIGPFELSLGAAGAFPRLQDPRIIWVGVEAGKQPFVTLASAVEEAMKAEGFRREGKGFSPHLTVGRTRSGRNLGVLVERLLSCAPLKGAMRVDEIQLVASELTSSGPIYSPVATVSLFRGRT
jgi:2'-5' RNA ligase